MSVVDQLRQEARAPRHRLASIAHDGAFVREIATRQFAALPVFANERAGSWYVDPALQKASGGGSVYFKSTDGHTGNWAFSVRRANLALLPVALERRGCVIVDATRNGKTLPDSFSRTIPIWCAVVNTALQRLGLAAASTGDARVHVPPRIVSRSEAAQIESRLDAWADALLAVPSCVQALRELAPFAPVPPLRALFVTPTSCPAFPWRDGSGLGFTPLVLVSASRAVRDGIERCAGASGWWYVQGAADDHEHWAAGLSPALYWRHAALLAAADDPAAAIAHAVATAPLSCSAVSFTEIGDTRVFLGRFDATRPVEALADAFATTPGAVAVLCAIPEPSADIYASRVFSMPVASDKRSRWALRRALPRALEWLGSHDGPVIVLDADDGHDAAAVVAVAILATLQCRRAAVDSLVSQDTPPALANVKTAVRNALALVQKHVPRANPTRALLNSVHDACVHFRASSHVSSVSAGR